MKMRWLLVICAAAVFAAFSGSTAYTQEEHHEHHWDEHHPQFDDHEHVVARTWWGSHRDRRVVGFRDEDRLPPDWGAALAGWVCVRPRLAEAVLSRAG